MTIQLSKTWESLRTSYWFLPALLSAGAACLSFLMVELDVRASSWLPLDAWWIYGGGAEGARAVLAAIVGSMISVTSVVFSITIVALTLASGQFGPRLLRSFMRDRANQLVLGVFIATFIYSLLVMGSVQGGDDRAFVPPLAVTVAIALVIASVGVLIFFIHHIALSIQADQVIASISEEVVEALERLFPESFADRTSGESELAPSILRNRGEPPGILEAQNDGYLQLIDGDRLLQLATDHDVVVELTHRPGDGVARGAPLALVTPPPGEPASLFEEMRMAFILGRHRTLTQDAEFGFLQLVEVGVRALSPGINDPFTAMSCVDHLSALLRRLAQKKTPARHRYDARNRLRLVADTTSFGGFVDTSYNQIRQNAGNSVAVLIRILEGIGSVLEVTHHDDQRAVLHEHAELVLRAAEAAGVDPRDMTDLRRRQAALPGLVVLSQA